MSDPIKWVRVQILTFTDTTQRKYEKDKTDGLVFLLAGNK